MKRSLAIPLLAVSAFLLAPLSALSGDAAKDFSPFLGKWVGERDKNLGWEVVCEKGQLRGYRSVTMEVVVENGKGYVFYSVGPFGSSPATTPHKKNAEVKIVNGEPRLCFDLGTNGVYFKLDNGRLKGYYTSARISSKCTVVRAP